MKYIAAWEIQDAWCKKICTMPYSAKEDAYAFAKEHGLTVYLIKQPLQDFKCQIIWISRSERRIFGKNEKTGEGWTKVFADFKIEILSELGIRDTETFTVHSYRGEVRVITSKGSIDLDDFRILAQKRWPTTWANLLIRM